ncbi:MAG: hypothetical protein LBT25_07480 [Candidatus Symbiothrix sp.]|jgi:hypothetical protein|nr:hypothetical protein [Candidatus Symbiothrix sp.]
MKKIIFMLIAVACSTALMAQTGSLSLDDYGVQAQALNTSISENFKKKDYKTGEKLTNEAIALFTRLSKEEQEERNNYA